MDVFTVREMVLHNNWANNRCLELAGELTPEQYMRAVGGSFPSVQATLTHIMWAEGMWLERWTGGTPQRMPSPEDFPSVHDLRFRWCEIARDLTHFTEGLTADRLQRVVRYVNFRGEVWEYPLWRQLYHLLHHSGYHRGQVTNQLRQIGIQLCTTDFLNFCDENDV